MIKNIGKFKQWTEEKLGNAKITLQTEDFQRLEVETERKRIAYEKLHAAAFLLQAQLLKRKISPEDNKSKRIPNDMLGVCMNNYGNEFTDETPLGVASINFGQAQSKLAVFQEEYADAMKTVYLEKLDEGLAQFREYQQLRKKLESRRLDYDSKLSRLQKSKKEKPELEQEMQAAKLKYEDSEYDVIQKMAALQEFEDVHCDVLQHLLDIQMEYFSHSLEVLTEVRNNWGHRQTAPTRRMTDLSRTSNNSSVDENAPMNMLRSPVVTPRKLSVGSKNGSYDNTLTLPAMTLSNSNTTRRMPPPARKNSNVSDDFQRTPPPALPRRQSLQAEAPMKNQRKATYEFGGENSDELSFRVGDVIQVVEEVDEGWWLGEIADPNGTVRRGIFPVNYTEAVSNGAGPPMPARPVLSSQHPSQSYIHEEPEMIEEETGSPFGDRSANNGFSYIRPNTSNQPSRTVSSSTIVSSPASSPVPQYKVATTKRAPPPPPPSSTRPNMVNSRSSSTMKSVRTAPSTPQLHVTQTDSYFESAVASCQECGCNDFTANVFKKGHCNNCFHKH
ncbi:uncharacterized protein B0P05DRAFT_313557 [Gilbertella persicaria]|uniref:uncharacterized protein n=1 Tax=Gilbertella persicaria TaxID=101096 RepID=UPI00221FFFD4|nr:uncharacterized protein B0P05DRAFT_313557 [Gilbertella persicaria]KAI8051375.1 hypothetical protein B0P05DRAFT_313557 [Gilbertella persicaria]